MTFFTDEQIEYMSTRDVRVAFLTELQFLSETAYVWNGHYKLTSGGHEWLPMHGIGSIEGLGTSSDAQSEAITMTIAGIPDQEPDILALALSQSVEANQQLVKIYIQFFDTDWQPIGNPVMMWFGFMQPPKVSRDISDPIQGPIQSITVTAENAFFNRSRPPYGRNTDRDQQARYPGDKFFQFTPTLKSKTFIYPNY